MKTFLNLAFGFLMLSLSVSALVIALEIAHDRSVKVCPVKLLQKADK